MASFVARVRSRLVLHIYAAALLQFLAVAAIVAVLGARSGPRPFMSDTADFVAETVASEGSSPASIQRALDRANATLHWSIAAYDDGGSLVVTAGTFPSPPPALWSAALGYEPSGLGPAPRGSRALPWGEGRVGHLVYAVPLGAPGGLGPVVLLVLVVVGIGSTLAARRIAAPLARLVAAARAFGAGDLSARAGLERSDELGDLSRAFDEMAERVTKSIRAERELLANVSHELRTPLQRIHIAVELASEGDAATARESLVDIAEDLGELERIVDDVLVATRLSLSSATGATSAVPPPRRERVDVSTLLDRAVARFRAAHPGRPVDFAPASDLPAIFADAMLIRRVVDNLLENSHKYTEMQSLPIALEASFNAQSVVIVVRDQGIGIGADDLERVFEPFFRADRSRTRSTGGLGLGLALARRIVESHGGKLVLESAAERGTTARLELHRDPPAG